jgi:hypothetical protein
MHKVGCTSLNSTLFILQNLGQGVQEISKFFDFPLTEEQVQTIAGQSTFNAMKESSKNTHGKHGNVFFRKGKFIIIQINCIHFTLFLSLLSPTMKLYFIPLIIVPHDETLLYSSHYCPPR